MEKINGIVYHILSNSATPPENKPLWEGIEGIYAIKAINPMNGLGMGKRDTSDKSVA